MANLVFDVIKNGARKIGVAISRYPPPGSFDRHLADLLTQLRVNVVLDIGAYIGDYARRLRAVGYNGRIISFEPVPASFERISAAMQHDRLWSGQPFGLSDEHRQATMHIHERGDFNSLLNIRKDTELAYGVDASLWNNASVDLRRLDSVLPELLRGVDSPRVFMKIDTQGHDITVLSGASGVLNLIHALQVELPAVELYDGMSSMSGALAYCKSAGFVPVGFYPVNMVEQVQISPEFDVLFKRFDGNLAGPNLHT
jgi:FkbM family methyltransferase